MKSIKEAYIWVGQASQDTRGTFTVSHNRQTSFAFSPYDENIVEDDIELMSAESKNN
jgi:hypothetical protein